MHKMENNSINKNQKALLKLLEARIHLGHKKSYWNPKVAPYLYGVRQGIHIIDLKKSISLLSKSLLLIFDILKNRKGRILILGNKYENALFVRSLSQWYENKVQNYFSQIAFIDKKWVGGSLTNQRIIKELTYYNQYSKRMPSLVILLNPNDYVLKEANNLNIPVIGILDTNTDPKYYSYPIPGNDDSLPSHYFYIELLSYLLYKTLPITLWKKRYRK